MVKKKVLISGLPGNMAANVAKLIMEQSDRYELLDIAFTGADVQEKSVSILGRDIRLIKPEERTNYLDALKGAVAIDYSTPSAYVDNCMFFIRHNIPFVIGTTGVTREEIERIVLEIKQSNISAVIDQNMSIELVLISSALEYLSETFPNALASHSGYGFESHQSGKKDRVSGTLRKWGAFIERLGVNFYMAEGDRTSTYGHAYHDLIILNERGNVRLGIKTEVEGRDTYCRGTLVALDYLISMMEKVTRRVYSMTDVLKGNHL